MSASRFPPIYHVAARCCPGVVVLLAAGLSVSAQDEKFQGKTVAEWRVALKNPDARVRLAAVLALGEAGRAAEVAVPDLAGALRDSNVFVRRAVAQTLGGLGPDAAPGVLALTRALSDQDALVRQLASTALTQAGDAAVEPLTLALKDKDYKVRALAAYALDGLGSRGKAAVEALAEAAKDPQLLVRQSALSALAKMGPAARTAWPVLTEALHDKNANVRSLAALALIGVGKDAVPEFSKMLMDKDSAVRATAIQGLANLREHLDADAVTALGKSLADDNSQVRRFAAGCLALVGVQARDLVGRDTVVTPLVRLMKDAVPSVRQTAVVALGQIGLDEEKDIETLAAGLADADLYVRMLTIHALAQYTHDEAPAEWRHQVLKAIARGLNDADRRVQNTAAQTLIAEKKYAVPGLTELLTKGKTATRVLAAAVLGEIGAEAAGAVPALEAMSRESTELGRYAATFALARIRP